MRPALLLVLLAAVVVLTGVSCGKGQKSPEGKKRKTAETIAVLGALPLQVAHPADNPPSPEKVALGRLLFFDPVLSGNRDVACATCHQPDFGYAEFLETSIGVNGTGSGSKRRFLPPNDIPFVKRNSQSLLNTAYNGITNSGAYHAGAAPMFWDLRAKGLEEQALIPIRTLEEMRGHAYAETSIIGEVLERIRKIPEYNSLFAQAFGAGADPVNEENLAKAIAAFERTLVAGNTRFDQYMRGDSGALSTGEKEGMNLFLQSGCAKCHHGPMFSDYKLHTLGVPDSENAGEPDAGIHNDFAFRTPTLRNLRFTAPYMHSGKFSTLKQVLEFYEDISGGKIPNRNVTRVDPLVAEMTVNFKDISRIVEFINVLNDNTFDSTIPEKVPSGLMVGGNIK